MPTNCWLWTGCLDPDGYGRFNVQKAGRWCPMPAQRVAWELVVGPIPDGLLVCHHCDNPACVRPNHPEHCFLGTQLDNMRDMAAKGRGRKGRTVKTALTT